jgi:hypothetical protein
MSRQPRTKYLDYSEFNMIIYKVIMWDRSIVKTTRRVVSLVVLQMCQRPEIIWNDAQAHVYK